MQCTTISDNNKLTVELLDFGARIHRINFDGIELALSYPNLSDYLTDPYYLGASVGPIANRVAAGKISINANTYQMPLNENDHCLHSGGFGFDKETWTLINATKNTAEYQLVYDMNRVGMEGRLIVIAQYRITNNSLSIEYAAKSDTTTFINPTNHVYLNLAGMGNIADHRFQVLANNFTEVDQCNIPNGERGTLTPPFDYKILESEMPEFAGHIDHHFELNNGWSNQLATMLTASSDTSGISVKVSGNSPGFQFYTGKFLGSPFLPSAGFCVETQFAPNAINQAEFFSPLLEVGEEHRQTTVFDFNSSI